MKTNKETLRAAMDRRLSFLDEMPSCRAALERRIAEEEKPVMMKKLSVGLIVALTLLSLTVIALAAGLIFSPRADAARIADQALEEKYGVTLEMQTFFVRQTEKLPDGAVQVTYTGWDALEYVLGVYTVQVKDGRAVFVRWSHDGEDTAGGYAAEAWGVEQLREMLAYNSTHDNMDAFEPQAVAIAERHNAARKQPEKATEEEYKAYFAEWDRAKAAAREAAKLSEEGMAAVGKEAIVGSYALREDQAGLLELYTRLNSDWPEEWYEMINGQPCFMVEYLLTQDPDHPEVHLEKDGAYVAYVNVETGRIEEITYESGMGGNG